MYVPLLVVVINSFNPNQSMTWPPSGFTFDWWQRAARSEGARSAVVTSVEVAFVATVIALVLGTLISFALQRYDFFGKNSVNLLVIPADRASGNCHRYCAQQRLPGHPQPSADDPYRGSRSHDVLHRDGIQQRHRQTASYGRQSRRSVG